MRTRTVVHPQKRITVALFLVMISFSLLSALLATRSPLHGLIELGILVGVLVTLWTTFSLRKFVWLILVAKPLIDLTWRWRFFTVAEQGVNIQSLVGLLVIASTGLAVFLWGKRLIVDLKVVLLLCFATLSVLLTPVSWGINELVRLFAGVSFFFTAGVVLDSEESFDRFAKYFILTVSVPVILALLQKVGVLPFEYWDWIEGHRVGRVSGTYKHPLGMIYFLIYAIPMALYFLDKYKKRSICHLLLWLFIGLSLVTIAFTYHRTAFITIGIEIWLWMVLTRKYRQAFLLMLGGGLLAFWLRGELQVLYASLLDAFYGKIPMWKFLRGRGATWYLFLRALLTSHPLYWLLGRGGSVAEGWVPGSGYWSSHEPHNDFIRILHTYGSVGLGLYLSILFTFLRHSLRLHRARDPFLHRLGSLMIVVLVSIVLLSITTEPMRYPTGVWYLFALGAVVRVQYRRLRLESAMGES